MIKAAIVGSAVRTEPLCGPNRWVGGEVLGPRSGPYGNGERNPWMIAI